MVDLHAVHRPAVQSTGFDRSPPTVLMPDADSRHQVLETRPPALWRSGRLEDTGKGRGLQGCSASVSGKEDLGSRSEEREREREGEVLELCHMSEQGLFVALEDAVERVKSLIYIRSLGDFSQTELIGHQLFKVVPS